MSKVWLITGSSRGLGWEIAKAALAGRYRLIEGPAPAAPSEQPTLWVTRIGQVGHRDMIFLTNYPPSP